MGRASFTATRIGGVLSKQFDVRKEHPDVLQPMLKEFAEADATDNEVATGG